jgi:methenyltetrahydromethanopterin cyclohydrolase
MMFASQIWICVKDIQNGELAELTQRMPSSSSASYGEPFLQTLKNAGGFYAIDPGLFAPAEVTLVSFDNGKAFHAGGMDLSRLNKSWEE